MTEKSKMSLQEAMDATSHKIKEVRVTEGEDAEDFESVVCATVESVPIPGCASTIEICSRCPNRIWVALTSPKNPPRICYHCYVSMVHALDDSQKFEIGITSVVAKKIFTKGKLS